MSLSHPDQQSLRGIEDSDPTDTPSSPQYDISCVLKVHSVAWPLLDGYRVRNLKRPVSAWHVTKNGRVGNISSEGAGQNETDFSFVQPDDATALVTSCKRKHWQGRHWSGVFRIISYNWENTLLSYHAFMGC